MRGFETLGWLAWRNSQPERVVDEGLFNLQRNIEQIELLAYSRRFGPANPSTSTRLVSLAVYIILSF